MMELKSASLRIISLILVVVTEISTDPKRENAILISYNDPLTGNHESADWLGKEGLWNA